MLMIMTIVMMTMMVMKIIILMFKLCIANILKLTLSVAKKPKPTRSSLAKELRLAARSKFHLARIILKFHPRELFYDNISIIMDNFAIERNNLTISLAKK